MLPSMDEQGIPESQGGPQRRVYPPAEVQARLEVSASGLRRLAGIYERTMGPLPRDERGRVWPEEAVEELERARALVHEQRAVSIEAALRGQEGPESVTGDASWPGPYPDPGAVLQGRQDVGVAILEELRALRMLVEEQNHRIAELEEVVRGGRELEAEDHPATVARPDEEASRDEPQTATAVPEAAVGETDLTGASGDAQMDISRSVEEESTVEYRPEDRGGSAWRRVLTWFGFGGREGSNANRRRP